MMEVYCYHVQPPLHWCPKCFAITSAIIKIKQNYKGKHFGHLSKLGVFSSITFSHTCDEAMLG